MIMNKRNFMGKKRSNRNEERSITFKRLIVEDFNKALEKLDKRDTPRNYFIYAGEKGSNIIELYYNSVIGLISEDECYIRTKGIMENAYIHPEWDYWSKPIAWRENIWKNFKTNEIVEVIEEDEHGDEILNISGRRDGF